MSGNFSSTSVLRFLGEAILHGTSADVHSPHHHHDEDFPAGLLPTPTLQRTWDFPFQGLKSEVVSVNEGMWRGVGGVTLNE